MKRLLLTSALLCLCNVLRAQTTAPVAGDAMTLIDFLTKDYPLTLADRDQVIASDRHQVIVLFEKYLPKSSITVNRNDVTKKFKEWKKSSDLLSAAKSDNGNALYNEVDGKKDLLYLKLYENDDSEFAMITAAYESQIPKNIYLSEVADTFQKKYAALQNNKTDSYATAKHDYSIQKSLPFFGGDLSFSTAIDGLSRFLAKRIKAEIALYGIQKIRDFLEHPTEANYGYEILAILPGTCKYLKSYDGDQILNFPNELKQHLEVDLNDLLKNAVNLKATPRIIRYIEKYPDLDFAFEGLELLPKMSEIKNPVDFFTIAENSRNLARWRRPEADYRKYNIAQSLHILTLFSYALCIEENGEQKFISTSAIAQYMSPEFYFLFVGMLAQQNKLYFNIEFKNANGTTSEMDLFALMRQVPTNNVAQIAQSVQELKSILVPISEHAEKIYNLSVDIRKKKKNGESIPFQTIHDLADEFIGFSSEMAESLDLLQDYGFIDLNGTIDFSDKLSGYFEAAKVGNEIFADLNAKRYAHALTASIGLADKLYSNRNLTAANPQINLGGNSLHEISNILALNGTPSFVQLLEMRRSIPIISGFAGSLAANPNLTQLRSEISVLADDLRVLNALNPASIATVEGDIASIKMQLRAKKAQLLAHFEVRRMIDAEIAKDKLPIGANAQTALSEAIDQYISATYDHVLFGDPLDAAIIKNIAAQLRLLSPSTTESVFKGYDKTAIGLINFLNDMATATDAEGVEKAIENFALPTGSSSIKDNTKCNISINSFPGVLGGYEYTHGEPQANFIGLTVPVGFYVQPWPSATWGSLGFFVPIIDIAAPVRVRLDGNRDTEALPDFEFKDVFAPGFYLSYGLKGNPFAFNLGVQYGPKLRGIKNENDSTILETRDSFRFGLGVVIDIPLLTLSNRPK